MTEQTKLPEPLAKQAIDVLVGTIEELVHMNASSLTLDDVAERIDRVFAGRIVSESAAYEVQLIRIELYRAFGLSK